MITTARGQVINMDALKESSSRPLSSPNKNDIRKTQQKKPRALNVRGYMPSQGKATPPELPDEIKETLAARDRIAKNPNASQYKTKTMADITGVRIDKPKRHKSKTANPEQASNEVLSEILSDLEGQGTEKRSTEGNSKVRSGRA